MAERLPLEAAKNVTSPSLASFGSNPGSNDLSNASINRLNIQSNKPKIKLNWIKSSYSQILSNGSSPITNCSVAGHNEHSQPDASNRNGTKTKDNESHNETE